MAVASRVVALAALLLVALSVCVMAHEPFHNQQQQQHRARHGGRHGAERGHVAGGSAQLSVGMLRPLADGGVVVEAFELSVRGGSLASSLRAMALGSRVLPAIAAPLEPSERPSDWPQNLQASYCDSLASPREQTSCLMELIRRMEEDANRKIEILIDTDVGQQAQIAGLWVVLLLFLLLGTCGMCLKMLRRRHRRNTYRRIQKKLNKLEQIARSPDDHEHVVPHSTTPSASNEPDYSLTYNPSMFSVPPSPQVLFQPIQVMPQYYPLPSQE